MIDMKALVEAAAKALAGDGWPIEGQMVVDFLGRTAPLDLDIAREPYRAMARRALAAALPMLVEHLAEACLNSERYEFDRVTADSIIRAEGARIVAALGVRRG